MRCERKTHDNSIAGCPEACHCVLVMLWLGKDFPLQVSVTQGGGVEATDLLMTKARTILWHGI